MYYSTYLELEWNIFCIYGAMQVTLCFARTTDSFPIDVHYNFLCLHRKLILYFFRLSQHLTDPISVWSSWKGHSSSHKLLQIVTPLHFCHEIPLFQNMSTSCLVASVFLCNRYTYWDVASIKSSDAIVHKSITSTHSFTPFLLSQIHPNCTINFSQGLFIFM